MLQAWMVAGQPHYRRQCHRIGKMSRGLKRVAIFQIHSLRFGPSFFLRMSLSQTAARFCMIRLNRRRRLALIDNEAAGFDFLSSLTAQVDVAGHDRFACARILVDGPQHQLAVALPADGHVGIAIAIDEACPAHRQIDDIALPVA
jgi:hypothetical protein